MGKGDLKRARDAQDDDGEAKVAKKTAGGDIAASKGARKSASSGSEPTKGQDVDGNTYWEISKMRRVGISHFKNNTLINIREYYESAGQMRPGKKGISLSLEQYQMLVKAIPFINAELQQDGVALAQLTDDGAALAGESSTLVKRTKKKTKKANIDTTSDEDSS